MISFFSKSNYNELQAIGLAAAAKLASVDGIQYEVGSFNEALCKEVKFVYYF